ncbi:MAG: NUDIX domain-containing protein [Chloroflexota bacterium]|nr:NUDIX domain-containing protein [Chloroflexota bacterium]
MTDHQTPPAADVPRDPSGYPDPGRPGRCIRCGTPTEEADRGGRARPVCPNCGWVYYARNALGAALAIEGPGGILLVQRSHEPYKGEWMLPAGFVEYGEFAEESAVREAEEETGLRVELTGLWGLYFGTDDPRNVAHLAVYGARVVGGDLTPGDDAIDARFFPRGQLPANVAFEAHRQALADWERDPSRPSARTLGHWRRR